MVKGLQVEWKSCFRTVSLNHTQAALACWNNLIAVGGYPYSLTILNAITGICTSILSGHTGGVRTLTFSSDGTFLVSGSDDKTVILWDVQTGGVIKTFHGHTDAVVSVSISLDYITIASGSPDKTICLWNTQTGGCHCTINLYSGVCSVSFSPTNSKLIMSASSDHAIQQWDIGGHKIGPAYEGDGVAFSSDGTFFVSWKGTVATIQKFGSGVVVTKLQVSRNNFECCCFSPNGKSLVGSAGQTIYLWDITSSDPHLIKTFVGHTDDILSLGFSSALISLSIDQSIKFWQVGASLANSVETNLESTLPALPSIRSVSLQANHGIFISSDSDGVVKTWDISTGLCKTSFQTPAQHFKCGDACLINSTLIFAWFASSKIYIWGAEEMELIQTVNVPSYSWIDGFRISGDGSKVFILGGRFIRAWSVRTGEVVGEVEFKDSQPSSLIVDGSRVWVCFGYSLVQEWDFGHPGSIPIPVSSGSTNRPNFGIVNGNLGWGFIGPPWTKDMDIREDVFQLSLTGGYGRFTSAQWDGQYLVAGYNSGELLILNFNQRIP